MPSGSQKEYLILSIREHLELWDISKNEYTDNTKKQTAWARVAKCFRLSGIFIIFWL